MATRQINWRTINNKAYYVHSILGSDIIGDGSREHPFKTIQHAFSYVPLKDTVVCIGVFSGHILNSYKNIYSDHLGAMVYDGKEEFLLYGSACYNVIVKNMPQVNSDVTSLYTIAGLGSRDDSSQHNSNIEFLPGIGNNNIVHNCTIAKGVIGGSINNIYTSYNVFSKLKKGYSGIYFGHGIPENVNSRNNTIYDLPLSHRRKNNTTSNNTANYKNLCIRYIFAKVAMLAIDNYMKYKECLFTADTLWYLDLDGNNMISYADMDAVIAQGNADNRGDAILWIMQNTYGITDTKSLPIFENCIFTDKLSTDVLNDPENLDFTLKYSQDNPAILGAGAYIGALPMALNIAIKQNSDGQTNCFDKRTLSGCLTIDSNNILNIDIASASNTGQLLSKVISINPQELQFSGIYALTENHIASQNVILNRNNPFTQRYLDTDDLAVGKYFVVGGMIAYDDVNYSDGDTFIVTEDNTRFTIADGSPKVYFIEEQNLVNVVYVRTKAAIYEHLNSTDTLQVGGIYLNDSDNTMQYAGRTIAPHESFIAEQGYTTFTAADGQVGILFDDTRTTESEWIPSDAFGEYFVYRSNGAIQHDNYGIPISSGNSLAHVNSSNGGYSNTLNKSIMKQHFVQFGIFVIKIS